MTTLAEVGKGVISERRELYAVGLKDCGQASFLRALADHGVIFPLANDLEAEREALERSDSYPDETGAPMWALVQAAERRYGYSGDAVAVMATAVRTPGFTLVMQGPFDRFPLFQQRWQLGGTFGHAVAYRVLSATEGTLLDPLAPMGFLGDRVTPEVMERFCWGPSYTRSMKWETPMLKSTDFPPAPKIVNIPVGKTIYDLSGVADFDLSVAAKDVYAPFVSGIWRAIVRRTGEVALVKVADCTNVRPLVADVKHNWALTEDGKVLWAGTR